MREALALVRRDWLVAVSYRFNLVVSFASLAVTVLPVYFVARSLQPVMANTIRGQGSDFFTFVLLGMVAFEFVSAGVGGIPTAVATGIRNGTLEALFATPVRLPALLAGWMGYRLLWAFARAAFLLAAGWVLGAHIAPGRVLMAGFILLMILLAYVPIGLLGAAATLVFRTSGPLLTGTMATSMLLGGIYFPTHVIPSVVRFVSDAVPLTYGLRALRRFALEGSPLAALSHDLAILLGLIVVLFAIGTIALRGALRYARATGTLAHY